MADEQARIVLLRFETRGLAAHAKRRVTMLDCKADIDPYDFYIVRCDVPFWPLPFDEIWVKWRLAVLGGNAGLSDGIFAMPTQERKKFFLQLESGLHDAENGCCRITKVVVPEPRVANTAHPIAVRPRRDLPHAHFESIVGYSP